MVKTKDNAISEKILRTASDLFYRNGYRATGINEVIRKSGVAKATFYSHFPSKDDLCIAYVRRMAETDWNEMKKAVEAMGTPKKQLIGMTEMLGGWLKSTECKGCGFLNLIPEITDPKHPVRREAINHYDKIRAFVKKLFAALKGSRTRAGEIEELTDKYMLIFTGGIAMSEIYGNVQPIESATEAIKQLVEG